MQWDNFIWFALSSAILWIIAAVLAYNARHYRKTIILTLAGIAIFALFIAGMWISLERPPMRTMGETRLWYSFFLPLAGLFIYIRWKHNWILTFSSVMALIFICINLLKPEIHNKSLMPALQSPWFVPHVIVYMLAYSILGVAFLKAVYLLIFSKTEKMTSSMLLCDNLVYTGNALIATGMLLGAIWAKEAWGHYWSWDPKETWAAGTWITYLLYMHFRLHNQSKPKTALYLLIISFIILQICWFGVNYLPSAKGNSVHVYG